MPSDPPTQLRDRLDPDEPAISIVRRLRNAGFEALLAGGCVRDLLRGATPEDFDVATSARPDDVCRLFRPTRRVGAAFGVVLVRERGQWIEVATFRADGEYLDGRRPIRVTFCDAKHDAERRDFTINGMFLDPISGEVLDFVDGRSDLAARRIRAIGDPAARFAEDHLRLMRAVRFASRLDFEIEPGTRAAITAHAASLRQVAAERVHDELSRMLASPTRGRATRLLAELSLLEHIWLAPPIEPAHQAETLALIAALPPEATFEAALAALLYRLSPAEAEARCRALTCSSAERSAVGWLVAHQGDLDNPERPSLAEFKRLLASPSFTALRDLALARTALRGAGDHTAAAIDIRRAGIAPAQIAPPPFVTGEDLAARGVAPGPRYGRVLGELYELQLNERLTARDAALVELDRILRDSPS